MQMQRRIILAVLAALAVLAMAAGPAAAFNPDTLVTVGSPPTPVLPEQAERAGAGGRRQPPERPGRRRQRRDRHGGVQRRRPTTPARSRPGVGVSGVYFSFDSGTTWTQPTYTGLTARDCLGARGDPTRRARRSVGPDRHAAVVLRERPGLRRRPGASRSVRGPAPAASAGRNGSRLYYANLTSNLGATRSEQAFRGFEAIAVSRTDNVAAAAAGEQRLVTARGLPPVIISRQSSTTFSDKEQIWADNASSSPFFGTVYVCWAAFRGQEKGNAAPAPLQVAVSHDGGDTWTQHQITAGGQQQPAQPARRLHDPHRQPRQRLRVRRRHASSGRQAGVRVDVDVSTNGGQHLVAGRRRSPARSPSRARSTRCRAGRSSTASPARAATSRRRRASTSPTAPRPAPTRRTGS